jgi:hypothetical protein
MTADFGFVTYAARGQPDEFPPRRAGYRHAERRFSNARGPTKQSWILASSKLAHGQEFENAIPVFQL